MHDDAVLHDRDAVTDADRLVEIVGDEQCGFLQLRDQAGTDRWPEWLWRAGLDPAHATDGPVIVDPNVRVQSAVDGHGLVLVSSPLIQAEIDAGDLVEPFDIRLQDLGYYLIYRQHSEQHLAFRLFRQWLRTQIDIYTEELTAGA
ncbi:MAG: hypothetical protein F4128_01905 [Gammaproteobacteria bacterium]|nr:hypothetical protein [Gammaproteobacteria bacterium]